MEAVEFRFDRFMVLGCNGIGPRVLKFSIGLLGGLGRRVIGFRRFKGLG